MSNKISRYSDIINLPHHQSTRRPHMSVYNRAAQFAPFAALVGYNEMVQEMAGLLLLDRKMILSEDEKMILDKKLQIVLENIKVQPEIKVIFFDEQTNKLGGSYTLYSGRVKKVEEYPPGIVFVDGQKIKLEDIYKMYCELFEQYEIYEPDVFADKLRSTANADEIVRASRGYVAEALNTKEMITL